MDSLSDLLNQLRGFDSVKFEKSLNKEDAEKFRPYIMNHHKMMLRYKEALNTLDRYGLLDKLK